MILRIALYIVAGYLAGSGWMMTRSIQRKVGKIMADVASIQALVSAINDETNAVAAKVDAQTAKIAELQAKLDGGGVVTAADLQAIQDGLQPISDRLQAIGADPAQPVPPVNG